jgi:hypothetical protein
MPSGRSRPSGLGMCTRRTGDARYLPDCTRACRSRRFTSRSCAYSCHLIPSAPGAASARSDANAAHSRSKVTWCSSAVNRASLSRTATSRTRPSPGDTLIPALRPGRAVLPVFPAAHFLSSPASAAEALFSGLAGTTKRSGCSRPCIPGLPPLAFPGRPARRPRGRAGASPPGSRARRFRTCHGSPTARGPPAARANAAGGIAFRSCRRRRHPDRAHFAAQSPGLRVPPPTLHHHPHEQQRMT